MFEAPRLTFRLVSVALSLVLSVVALAADSQATSVFRAGASAINISPLKLPVVINGGTTERTADKITEPQSERKIRERVLEMLTKVSQQRVDETPVKSN